MDEIGCHRLQCSVFHIPASYHAEGVHRAAAYYAAQHCHWVLHVTYYIGKLNACLWGIAGFAGCLANATSLGNVCHIGGSICV